MVQFLFNRYNHINLDQKMSAKHPVLDSDYLQEIYGGDQSIMQIMFETFLEDSLSTWEEIYQAIQDDNFQKVAELSHRVKPSFSMVGFTQLYPKIQAFESLAKTGSNKTVLLASFQALNEEVKQVKKVIEEELNSMNPE